MISLLHFAVQFIKTIHFREDFVRGMIVRGIEVQAFLPIPLTIIPLTPQAFSLIRSNIRARLRTQDETRFGRNEKKNVLFPCQ
jgi:hypothetical protein